MDEGLIKKLVLHSILSQRFRKAMKEAGIDFNNVDFAKKCRHNWFVPNDELIKIDYKIKNGVERPISIFKSHNYLEDFLKDKTVNCPSPAMLRSLARELGYRSTEYYLRKDRDGFLEKDEIDNPKYRRKHQYDLLPHLQKEVNVDELLEAYGYLEFVPPNSFRLTQKAYKSPRVQLLLKNKEKEQQRINKLRTQQDKMLAEQAVDKTKKRAAALRKFFNVSKWSK